MAYDDPYLDDPNEAQPWEPPPPQIPWVGGSGQGVWAPGYDPGQNWNGGAPPANNDPYANYNNGSPVDAPLDPGKTWEWSGPAEPMWNMSTNSWDTGRWNQVAGTTPPKPSGGPPPPSSGAVPPRPATGMGGGGGFGGGGGSNINVPSNQLPQWILDLFNRVPEKTPVQAAYQDALLKYMGKAQQTPSLDDPTLAPQVEVFRAANQRSTERQRRSAVERASATGQGQSGYLDNIINKGVQDQGFNTANFNAQLLGGEMTKRRDELQAALQLARATGDAEAQRELQTRLAQVSAAMQQQGLNLQGQLGMGDLDLRWAGLGANTMLGMEGLNQRALEMIMRGL